MSDPTQEQVLEYINAQMCPWCPRGPFQVLARHTYNAHGIDRYALREAAGLLRSSKGICAPEITERTTELSLERHAALTPEQEEELTRRRVEGMKDAFTPERRSAAMRERWRRMDEGQREHILGSLNESIPLEERGRRISEAQRRVDPTVRSERARAAALAGARKRAGR